MPFLVSTCLTRAGAMLNDPGNATYTQTLLLPHIQNAWKRLEMGFMENDLAYTEEMSAKMDIPLNTLVLDDSSAPVIPVDLIHVFNIWEKPDNATVDEYVQMIEVDYLPNRLQDTNLTEWQWREGAIYFVGATVAVDIKISYEKHLIAITAANVNIYMMETELYLAAQTAAFAALILGGNAELSASHQAIADDQYKRIINNRVKAEQNLPVRRRAYGFYRRARRI